MTLLRDLHPDDFAAVFDIVADYRVVRSVGSWPWPAQPGFTRKRLSTPEAQAGKVQAICEGGELAGIIFLVRGRLVRGELGYLLGQRFWGRGLASRAVAEMLARGFRDEGLGLVEASVWADNLASARVLVKSGFVFEAADTAFGVARGCVSAINRYRLTRAAWASNRPMIIATARLKIAPFRADDATGFAHVMNDADISRMMQSIPHPFTPEMAAGWIAKRQWAGKPGFSLAIRLQGRVIGWVGMGGTPLSVAYALGRGYWGQGYASEAVAAFLAEMRARFGAQGLEAGAYADNPASARVLEKLGFIKTGEIDDKSDARLEPRRLLQYRMQAAQTMGGGEARNEVS
ncbi:MAG: GNAT family N-acetyltransferase [Paracoccaceae bacterium]